MMKRTGLSLAVLAIVGLFVAFNVNAEEKKSGPINDKCPLAGKAVNPEKTIDIKVSFCCNNCKGKFDKDLAANIGKVKALDKCPLSGKDISEDASTTVTVAFCCGNCQGKAKKDPAAVLAKVKVKE
ncbi:MAG: hypothetical protein WD768_10740 [Phycisphaeraceae bacterium]